MKKNSTYKKFLVTQTRIAHVFVFPDDEDLYISDYHAAECMAKDWDIVKEDIEFEGVFIEE